MRGVFVLRGAEMQKPETRNYTLLTRVAVSENRSEMMQKRRLRTSLIGAGANGTR